MYPLPPFFPTADSGYVNSERYNTIDIEEDNEVVHPISVRQRGWEKEDRWWRARKNCLINLLRLSVWIGVEVQLSALGLNFVYLPVVN